MDITPFVSDLQRQLIAAAERDFTDAGDNGVDDARASAERLASGLDAATRLVLLDALSAAAGEITRDLVPGSVDLRLRGRELEFVVAQASADTRDADVATEPAIDLEDTGSTRTTLRLPDALKTRVDQAATAAGVSVNTWLVQAVAAALAPKQHRRASPRPLRTGDDFAGWAR
ncbi:toxin-antitoxin system HicB family antitoxin [Tsukamurella ocularis]|uniref:toxin-antitoxin system HicB family antitoxin n=1 Tax=Tsukamurella ocularis TaxID=1970234 RepID=UPI0021675B9E|nr:toxin-antitoxin system HicB family antitoxin [Tsukamurella ocularis]MCS3778385.1 putative DNA binding CopG/RHH family protein [Tsukamurella ocularis]MCS3789086.1 putative DNA binding CopG/RHH family protein [Tsukamurella ocularis]MCS3852937.1 putative DNA binding CopG/RHH family protein [Tsukamurella ocularis]